MSEKTLIHFGKHEIKEIQSLITYLEKEIEFWGSINKTDNYRDSALNTYIIFTNFLNTVNNEISKGIDDLTLANLINTHIRNNTHNINTFTHHYHLSRNSPISKQIKDISLQHSVAIASQFLNFIDTNTSKLKTNINIGNNILPYLLAYEFCHQDSDLLKRRNSEKRTNKSIRDEIESTLLDLEDRKNILFQETKQDCISLFNNFKLITDNASSALKTQINTQDKSITEKVTNWEQEKDRLEKLYKEDLRFKSPAEYWKNLASTYNTRALVASIISGVFITITLIFLATFFYTWLDGTQLTLNLGSLKGAFIFASIIAIVGFTLKSLSKYIFSSLHLAQDALEREQLTHFYLALGNETELKEKDKELILTSLFSRTETGLLTNEHGPTLPVQDIARSFSNKAG